MSDVFDPLGLENLGDSIARAALARPLNPLPLDQRVQGAGIYLVYYHGSFDLYAPIAGRRDEVPIYVGKADPEGSRKGLSSPARSYAVYTRLGQHAESISQVANLELGDFRCRYLLLDPVWIGLGEVTLIRRFQPLWNLVVEGFGVKDPGKGRAGQRRSDWDVLHPGRSWAAKLPEATARLDGLRVRVAQHLARLPGF